MKIAIIGAEFPDGGAVAHRLFMMARGLASRGHETYLLVPEKFSPGELTEDVGGVKLIWGGYGVKKDNETYFHKINKRLLLIKSFFKVLSNGLDWLILYDIGLDGLPFLLLARKYRFNVAAETCDVRIILYNSFKDKLIKFWYYIAERHLSSRYDINFTITSYLEKHLRSMAPNVPTLIIPAIVDVEEFHYDQELGRLFRNKWGIQDEFLITYTGSLQRIHGLEILLHAVHKLIRSGKSIKLIVCGRFVYDSRKEEIMKLMDEYQLYDQVVFTGFLSTAEVGGALSAADILVAPQIDHVANLAGFPQKLAEYLVMGKPVVASATGDIPRYLRDNDNALLCKPGDPESLTRALTELLDNPDLRQRLSRRAWETALKHFDCRVLAGYIESKFVEIRQSSG